MIDWIRSNPTLFLFVVCGMALWVSLAVDYVKEYLDQISPPLIVLAFSLVSTVVMYFCGSAYLKLPIEWYEAIPCIMSCVFISYIAQKGYKALVEKFKKLSGEDEEDEEDE